MVPQKIRYFFNRFYEMGMVTTWDIITKRLDKRIFFAQGRKNPFAKKHFTSDFQKLFTQMKNNDFCAKILNDPLFLQVLPQTADVLKQADNIAQGSISILGYGTVMLQFDTMPWHQDFFCTKQSPAAWQNAFCDTIYIPNNVILNKNERMPDIKVPWELSRMHQLVTLGIGYAKAQELNDAARIKRYAEVFVTVVCDWQVKNPTLQGVNWVNPMEVAIRAINFMWAFHFFKNDTNITIDFWHNFVHMLYDHADYLEHTWEISDKPNNHYIADLLGHLYLCTFLTDTEKQTSKRDATRQSLITQFKHQILPDGTSYEGSTGYHRLVTEMLLHFVMLCKHTHQPIPDDIKNLYYEMRNFLSDCTLGNGILTLIGDNDSGKVVFGIHVQPPAQNKLISYKYFGLSIIKKYEWHVTFRHPTYNKRQPSGHFHNDMLAVTVSIGEEQIFVDPGTYVYTPNPYLRNVFRSSTYHNGPTVMMDSFQSDLFQLNRVPQERKLHYIYAVTEGYEIEDFYNPAPDITLHRKIHVMPKEQTCTIVDWYENRSKKKQAVQTYYMLAPGIVPEQESSTIWLLRKEAKNLAMLSSSAKFAKSQAFCSLQYGSKEQCWVLVMNISATGERVLLTKA